MKSFALFIVTILLIAGTIPCGAVTLNPEPDFRFAWNQFTVIGAVDSFAVLASDEGIQTATYDQKTDKFVAKSQLVTTKAPWRVVSNDSAVLVIFQDRSMYILDRMSLPSISVRSEIQLPPQTEDVLVTSTHVYLAAGFRGLLWAPFVDFCTLGAYDSAQDGVHVVSVSRSGNRLMAADDYNGVIEYQLAADGSPQMIDFLLLPFQCTGVMSLGDTALLVRQQEDSLIRLVKDSAGWKRDIATVLPYGCMSVFIMDTFMISIASDLAGFSVLNRGTMAVVGTVTNLAGPTIRFPAHFGEAGATRLVVPGQFGGLLQYWLDWFDVSYGAREAYFPSGAINSITFAGDWLVAGGLGGWCHAYDCKTGPAPDTETVVYDNIGIVAKVRFTQNGTVILNSALRKINLTRDQGSGPKPYATFFLGHAATDLSWGTAAIGADVPVFVWAGQDGYLYAFESDNTLTYKAHLAVPVAMRTALVVDSLLIVSVAKFGLQVYRINPDFSLSFKSSFGDVAEIELLLAVPLWTERIAAFWGNQLFELNVSNPSQVQIDTSTALPLHAIAGEVKDSLLCLVGGDSCAVFTFSPSSALPQFAGAAAFGGSSITTNGEIMAITNGKGIYTFDLRGPSEVEDDPELLPVTPVLPVNYPNPFNPTTTIQFEISRPGIMQVEIFNLLGERVKSFGSEYRPVGMHELLWDGQDDRGRKLASGTYICRITADGAARTGKMLLLK